MRNSSCASDDRSSFQGFHPSFPQGGSPGKSSASPPDLNASLAEPVTEPPGRPQTVELSLPQSPKTPEPVLSADTLNTSCALGTNENRQPADTAPGGENTAAKEENEDTVSDDGPVEIPSYFRFWLEEIETGERNRKEHFPDLPDFRGPSWNNTWMDEKAAEADTLHAGKTAVGQPETVPKTDEKKSAACPVQEGTKTQVKECGTGQVDVQTAKASTVRRPEGAKASKGKAKAASFKESIPFPFPEGTPQYLLSYPVEYPRLRARAALYQVKDLVAAIKPQVKDPFPGFALERKRNSVMFQFMAFALAPAVLCSLHWSMSLLVTAVGLSEQDNMALLTSMGRFWGLPVPLAEKVYNSTRIPKPYSGQPFILPRGSADDQKNKIKLITRALKVPGAVVVTVSDRPLAIDGRAFEEVFPVSYEFWEAPYSSSRTRNEYLRKEITIPEGAAGSYLEKCLRHKVWELDRIARSMAADVQGASPAAVNGMAEGAALRKLCEDLLELLFVRPAAHEKDLEDETEEDES